MNEKPIVTIDISEINLSRRALYEFVSSHERYDILFTYKTLDRIVCTFDGDLTFKRHWNTANFVFVFNGDTEGFSLVKNRVGVRMKCQSDDELSMLIDMFSVYQNRPKKPTT